MVYIVEADTIAQAWIKAVVMVYNNGIDIPTEYGNNARTLTEPLVVHINKPFLEPSTCDKLSDFKSEAIKEYCKKFLTVENTGHTYTYPNRLFDYPSLYDDWWMGNGDGNGFNQIRHIINELIKHPISRRQIAHTWVPNLDANMEHCPCLQDVQLAIYKSKINMIAHFRSNDMLDASLSNNNGLFVLQRYIRNCVDFSRLDIGYLEVYSTIPHIYEERLDSAKKVVDGAYEFLSYKEMENLNAVGV